ncbi:uncharacterized protein LOC129595462 [Paramacrobiotus metropolitanus]|uniref:uncharacterized protein LOC129595462 n=1 Tax=Paramacrobiotus metropolitanus TaxID=2943436 RepID=UPI002445E25D|nr:uncharacterized protein LOC129595462 [Paramacrobiotus metropolitanus]
MVFARAAFAVFVLYVYGLNAADYGTSPAPSYTPAPCTCVAVTQTHIITINNTVAPPKPDNRPWQYAIKVGDILYMTSIRAFKSFADRSIITYGGTYNEAIQVMTLANQILTEAGCKWENVHDLLALAVNGPSEFPLVDKAIADFCKTHNCTVFPWAGHLRTGGAMTDGALVEMTIQANNCNWP